MNTSQKSQIASSQKSPKGLTPKKGITKKNTLRSRLLTTLLPAVVIPLVIAGLVGEQIAERRLKRGVISGLEADTLLAHNATATFIRNSFKITETIALEPELLELMKISNQLAQEQKLVSQPIAALETQFASSKLLVSDERLNQDVNNYFKRVVRAGSVAEVFATQSDGFNVALSNPTSDFVQSDEEWWQTTKDKIKLLGDPTFDESAGQNVIPFSKAVYDPRSGQFIGVVKVGISINQLEDNIDAYLYGENKEGYKFQIVDSQRGVVFDDIEPTRSKDVNATETSQKAELLGGETILNAAKLILSVNDRSLSLSEAERVLKQQPEFSQIKFKSIKSFDREEIELTLKYDERIFSFAAVPDTTLVAVGSVDYSIIAEQGRDILIIYALTTIVLTLITTGVILILARQVTRPLTNLANTTRKVAEGDYNIFAKPEGTNETVVLADNFNQLISEVKNSLDSQRSLAEQQRQEKEQLEASIYTLIDEIADATEGDLTVRANLDSIELSTVADLFNAIIDNLQDIAVEAKESSEQVGSSLQKNEEAIRDLAEQAIEEAKETRKTLVSIEEMTQSIQFVAENASQAEQITKGTYSTVLSSTLDMEETVNSILKLRSTVGETSKKIKRLGESSQKISQAVSLIEEIALKTNVLAINASVEAGRAGEYGEGFTIVAEQVGSLAEQSAKATREIADIVSAIQLETQEVNQAMESGTAEVVETTRLVETTKQSLGVVLEKSQEINRLMGSISESTVSQASTSQDVANLIQKIAELSENTSISSEKVAKSILETAQVAKSLESTVSQFKVAN